MTRAGSVLLNVPTWAPLVTAVSRVVAVAGVAHRIARRRAEKELQQDILETVDCRNARWIRSGHGKQCGNIWQQGTVLALKVVRPSGVIRPDGILLPGNGVPVVGSLMTMSDPLQGGAGRSSGEAPARC
jgi:hypothetical protein